MPHEVGECVNVDCVLRKESMAIENIDTHIHICAYVGMLEFMYAYFEYKIS